MSSLASWWCCLSPHSCCSHFCPELMYPFTWLFLTRNMDPEGSVFKQVVTPCWQPWNCPPAPAASLQPSPQKVFQSSCAARASYSWGRINCFFYNFPGFNFFGMITVSLGARIVIFFYCDLSVSKKNTRLIWLLCNFGGGYKLRSPLLQAQRCPYYCLWLFPVMIPLESYTMYNILPYQMTDIQQHWSNLEIQCWVRRR